MQVRAKRKLGLASIWQRDRYPDQNGQIAWGEDRAQSSKGFSDAVAFSSQAIPLRAGADIVKPRTSAAGLSFRPV